MMAVRLADGRRVVFGSCAICRADFTQSSPGLPHDVRYPEAVADFNQLTTGDEHIPPSRQRGQYEQDGRCVVIDDDTALGAGEVSQEFRRVGRTAAPPPFAKVILEVAVATGDLVDPLQGHSGERCAAEVWYAG